MFNNLVNLNYIVVKTYIIYTYISIYLCYFLLHCITRYQKSFSDMQKEEDIILLILNHILFVTKILFKIFVRNRYSVNNTLSFDRYFMTE